MKKLLQKQPFSSTLLRMNPLPTGLLFCLVLLGACTHSPVSQTTLISTPKAYQQAKLGSPPHADFSVMAFNLENFFDNIHDEGTDDMNLDWSNEMVDKKVRNVAEVIRQVDQGHGPDVLLLEEIENERMLNKLNTEALKNLYPTHVLIHGFDTRGINLAVMSQWPLKNPPVLHRIPLKGKTEDDTKWMLKTRGIFEVNLLLPNQQTLTVFVVHFPSQHNPIYWREQAAEYLVSLIKSKGPQALVIAGGDFNITHTESDLFTKTLSQAGEVSHLVGCQQCLGTHNYKQDWSFLDALIFSEGLTSKKQSGWSLVPESIEVVNDGVNQKRKSGEPQSFRERTQTGVSDHFPIYARVRYK